MGCASSKSVTPAPASVEVKPSSVAKVAVKGLTQAPDNNAAAVIIPAGSASTAAAELVQALAVESCTATPRVGNSALIDAAAEAAPHLPAKQQQHDPEFDYEQELGNVPASTAASAAAAHQSSSSTTTVGGLLSHQPNWLNDSSSSSHVDNSSNNNYALPAAVRKAAFAPVAVFSNLSSGGTDARQPFSSSSSSTVKGSSSLPPISRGLGAAATAGSSRGGALPPLPAGQDLMQQSITVPMSGAAPAIVPASLAAAAQAVELPAPRRLTGSMGSRKVQEAPEAPRISSRGSCTAQQATSSSLLADAGAHDAEAQHAAAAADAAQQDYSQHGFNTQVAATSLSRSSSDTGSPSAAPSGTQAPAAGAAAIPITITSSSSSSSSSTMQLDKLDPSDPWSALQSQYVAAAGPGSPGSSLAGSSTAAAAAAAQRSGLAAGASKRATRVTQEADELVLVDSDDEVEVESSNCGRGQQQQDSLGPAATAAAEGGGGLPRAGRAVHVEGSFGSSSSLQHGHLGGGGSGGLAAEGSRVMRSGGQQARPHQAAGSGQFAAGGQTAVGGVTGHSGLAAESSRVKAGGWGAGSMAAAGTLMLGDEATEQQSDSYSEDGGFAAQPGRAGGAAAQDDVFGGDHLSPGPVAAGCSSARSCGGTGAVQQHVAAAGLLHQDDEQLLGLEDLDDVDALIEAELAAKNALPGDLAAKLAAFEAMADDDE